MAVDIIDAEHAAIYCNTTDWALGPIFDSREHAEDFLAWMAEADLGEFSMLPLAGHRDDPRSYSSVTLEQIVAKWRVERTDDEGDLVGP